MHRILAGAVVSCAFIIGATDAWAQSGKRRGFASHTRDLPEEQVTLESSFIEVSSELRKFFNWDDISGDDPSVVQHDAQPVSYGLGLQLGAQLGGLPLWAMFGGYYATALETNTTLANGDRVHGEVDNYGLGAGVRLLPFEAEHFNLFVWAMGFYEWNDGNFDIVDDPTRSEKRIHKSFSGDYGLGAMFLIGRSVGFDFGIGYNGQLNRKNADENFRVFLGLVINGPQRIF